MQVFGQLYFEQDAKGNGNGGARTGIHSVI